MRLKKGDVIDNLSLPSISGDHFDIKELPRKKILLTFYRFATCPFCNLRIYEINQRFSELENNLHIIAVFDAPLNFLMQTMRKHDTPFTILAFIPEYLGGPILIYIKKMVERQSN